MFSLNGKKLTVGACGVAVATVTGFLSDFRSLVEEPSQPEVLVKQVPQEPIELSIPYQEISNKKLASRHLKKEIEIEAFYLGPWNEEAVYALGSLDEFITLNHRDGSYVSKMGPLGSSDSEIPQFALLAPIALADEILKIKAYSKIRVKGTVEIKTNAYQQTVVVFTASEVKPVT